MAGEGFNLGTAIGYVEIDTTQIDVAMQRAQSAFRLGLDSMGSGLQQLGSTVSNVGGALTTLFTPLSAGLLKARNDFNDFNEALVNIQAVTGATAQETAKLSAQLLEIGEHSRAGPQAIAEAFYDIAGGVVDASTRMATLQAAVSAAEAGNADLAGTTKALISVMNGYGFSAEKAGFATDVMTKTVGVGVGTMDELASALPNVAGLANSVGISFDNLGAMMAFISTKGVTFNEAGTQISSMLTMLLKPTEDMQDALEKIGFSSGRAAIQQLGLIGTLKKLKEAGYDVETLGGRIEAMRGIIALTGQGADQFLDNFNNGLEGLTAATQAIQNASPAAQADFLNSALQTLSITVGEALAPAFNRALGQLLPLIDSVLAWVRANPELVGQIGTIILALGTAAPIIWAIGKAISAIGTLVSIAMGPFGLLIGAIALLYLAFQNNWLGIRDILQPVIDTIMTGVHTLIGVLGNFGNIVSDKGIGSAIMAIVNAFAQMLGLVENDQMSPFLERIGNVINFVVQGFGSFTDVLAETGSVTKAFAAGVAGAIGNFLLAIGVIAPKDFVKFQDGLENVINTVADFIFNKALPALGALANWFISDALPAVISFIRTTVIPAIEVFVNILAGIWSFVGPALTTLVDWFITSALPAVIAFINGSVIPAIQSFIGFLSGLWEIVGPHLERLANWFITEALPAILNFISTVVIPGIGQLINILTGIWNTVGPYLLLLADWFLNTALPAIVNFITTQVIPRIAEFGTTISNIWTTVQPFLQQLYDWFITTALPAVITALIDFKNNTIQPVIDVLSGLWNIVSPVLQTFADWFIKEGLPGIVTELTNFKNNVIQPVIDKLAGWWTSIQPGIDSVKTNLYNAWVWLDTNVLTPIRNAIQSVIDKFNEIKNTLTGGLGGYQGAGENAQTAMGLVTSGQKSSSDFLGALVQSVIQELHLGDFTGIHPGNQAYLVGSGAQPQLFAPKSDMMGIPNFDKVMAGAGDSSMHFHGPVNIYPADVADFWQQLQNQRDSRG